MEGVIEKVGVVGTKRNSHKYFCKNFKSFDMIHRFSLTRYTDQCKKGDEQSWDVWDKIFLIALFQKFK